MLCMEVVNLLRVDVHQAFSSNGMNFCRYFSLKSWTLAHQFLDLLVHCKGSPAWTVVYLVYWHEVLLFLALAEMHATVKRKILSSPFLLPSEPSEFDKARPMDKFLLLSMKINAESMRRIYRCISRTFGANFLIKTWGGGATYTPTLSFDLKYFI